MNYTCQNCGASADNSNSLCNPTSERLDSKFCGAPSLQVCDGKVAFMKYSCDACGSISADADRLCSPSEIK